MEMARTCAAGVVCTVLAVAVGALVGHADYEAVGSNRSASAPAQDGDIFARAEVLPVTDPDDPQGDWSVASGNARATNWGKEPTPELTTQGEAKIEEDVVKAGWNNPPLHPDDPDPKDPDPRWKWKLDARQDYYGDGGGGSRVAPDPETIFNGEYSVKASSIEFKVNGVVWKTSMWDPVEIKHTLHQNENITWNLGHGGTSTLTGGPWTWESAERLGPIVECRCKLEVVSKWDAKNAPQQSPPVTIYHKLVPVGVTPPTVKAVWVDLGYNVRSKKPEADGVE